MKHEFFDIVPEDYNDMRLLLEDYYRVKAEVDLPDDFYLDI
jgi:hypothetical protein